MTGDLSTSLTGFPILSSSLLDITDGESTHMKKGHHLPIAIIGLEPEVSGLITGWTALNKGGPPLGSAFSIRRAGVWRKSANGLVDNNISSLLSKTTGFDLICYILHG